ncbi:MAG: TetR/AcrR family transcriptional regulator [Cellvibrionaceae bacterium]
MNRSTNQNTPRRTQAERRAETQAAVLESACKLFGKQGYSDTALEDIAKDCDLTIRPIYHYFENKQNLFKAVVEATEERIIATYDSAPENHKIHPFIQRWRAFLDLCKEPEFRQIVLIDSPNVLGREHWTENAVTRTAQDTLEPYFAELPKLQAKFCARMIMAALAEAGLMIANSDNPKRARQQADQLVTTIVERVLSS